MDVGWDLLEDARWRVLTSIDADASLDWASLGVEWPRAFLASVNQALISLTPTPVSSIRAVMAVCVGRPLVVAVS